MRGVGLRLAGVLVAATVSGFAQESSQESATPASDTAVPRAATPVVPRVFHTAPGQFEIVVLDVTDAQQALALGRSVWDGLAGTLGLPSDGFPQPISVKFVPEEYWSSPAVFTVTIEPPGLVDVRVRWTSDVDPMIVRRAFIQGLILRQAAAWHGIGQPVVVPLWLEQACANMSLVRERPAMLDAFQQEAAKNATPPALRALLMWERGEVESRDWELASLWLLQQLQAEASADPARWGRWVRGVVGGEDPMMTLPRSYEGLWSSLADMEMWWQVGFHHQRRIRTLPVMSAEASRLWLADRSRWLAGREGREVVLPLADLRDFRDEPWVRAELTERWGQARTILGVIHPFYANTVLSLGRVYETALKGGSGRFVDALTDFRRDALDAQELEETVNAILDTAPRD